MLNKIGYYIVSNFYLIKFIAHIEVYFFMQDMEEFTWNYLQEMI
jgi:hypothetical protein